MDKYCTYFYYELYDIHHFKD
jgi:hypothetical protein